jgi:hypothetical protein
MLPSEMKRHLETVYGNLENTPREVFSRKLKKMNEQRASLWDNPFFKISIIISLAKM